MFKDKEILNKINHIDVMFNNLCKVIAEMSGDIERLKVLWEVPSEKQKCGKEDGKEDLKWVAVSHVDGVKEGKYICSSDGRVYNNRGHEMSMNRYKNTKKIYVQFWTGDKRAKAIELGKLIWGEFHNVNPALCDVKYKDGDATNCNINNLEGRAKEYTWSEWA